MRKYRNLCILIASILFAGCGSKDPCSRTGVIKDYLGQEGCTLVIQDKNGDLFIPENIQEFGLIFYDGQTVAYSFQLSSTSSSACNVGVPIILLCIDTNL